MKRHCVQICFLWVVILAGGRAPHFDAALARPHDDASKQIEITEIRWPGMPTAVRSVRTTDDDDWVKNLTIEIENTSAKPIVGLAYDIACPDPRGISNVITLEWGKVNAEGGSSLPQGTALLPGKRLVLTVPVDSGTALRMHQELTGPAAREAEITFQCANFGDGRCLTNDPDSLERGDSATLRRVAVEYVEPGPAPAPEAE